MSWMRKAYEESLQPGRIGRDFGHEASGQVLLQHEQVIHIAWSLAKIMKKNNRG